MAEMNRIHLNDCTLARPGGCALSFREKIAFCKMADRLNVSAIELPPIRQKRIDLLLIKSISSAVKNARIAVPVRLDGGDILEIRDALKEAPGARLQVTAPVSSVQMEYLCHLKPPALLAAIRKAITACREACADVEFVAEDATRADLPFLSMALQAALESGATTVTVSDTAGSMLPGEISAFLEKLKELAPELKSAKMGFACSNGLCMADACAVAAVEGGVTEIKAALHRTDCVSLTNLAQILKARGDSFGVRCDVSTEQIRRITDQIAALFGASDGNGILAGGNSEELTDQMINASESRDGVGRAAGRLGYDLSPEDLEKVWARFQEVAEKKELVSLRELDAIIASEAMQAPASYHDVRYTITTDNATGAMAHMRLMLHDTALEGVSIGDGPVDAAFQSIEKATGKHFELDDFQIRAIAEGHAALGETIVRLRNEGRLYSGRGLSTDIVGASVMAYINALNKIVFEEEEA